MAISDLDGKYHVKIDGNGFIVAHTRTGRFLYEKKPAPTFVNKFGSGDSSYRDSTFWQFWAQLNWRNGAKQERFDDTSKFWKSENVDVTQVERIKLSRALTSAGQAVAGAKATASVAWRATQSWWDNNYDYRKQITITAPGGVQIPSGYPIVVTEDTDALETAGKVRADRNDWRVVYWNGTSWVDLKRHYVSATRTVFATQASIPAGSTDSNYYLYYGYSSESTSQDPSSDADWNEIYVPEDANSPLVLAHTKEGSGTSVENTATGKTNNGSFSGSVSWVSSNTKFGFALDFPDNDTDFLSFPYASGMDVDYFTYEMFVKSDVANPNDGLLGFQDLKWLVSLSDGKISVELWGATGSVARTTTSSVLDDTNWHHIAVTFDGDVTVKVYKDGSLVESLDYSGTGQTFLRSNETQLTSIGKSFNGKISNVKFINAILTSFPHAFSDSITVSTGSEEQTQPPASSFQVFTGFDNGKIYSWDGSTTWTEEFDCRRLTWYESGGDADKIIGDSAGTEYAHAQSFQLSEAQTVKAVEVYLKKNAGTPGDITVRIETDNAGAPSGTLANANATATISAFTDTSYAWKEAAFSSTFTLSSSTTYWLVLKTAAAANDNNYVWRVDASSPSYADGNMADSSDGGSTWTAQSGWDAYFRILSQDTEVYCALVSSVGGTQKAWWGVGDISNETDGDARLYTYDGTNWALAHTFTNGTSSAVTSLAEYNDKIYAATAPQAYILSSSDASAWSQSTQIRVPQNPGFVWAMMEYNQRLYVGGGSPEYLPDEKYNGFVFYHDGVNWESLYPFDHTVITAMGFYDAFLFIGTYHGQVYIFDTATLDPLITFRDDYDYQVQITDFMFFDDKIYIALAPQDGTGDTNSALWLFERHGISAVNAIPSGLSVTGLYHFVQANNTLLVGGDNGYMFQIDKSNYEASGWLQTSYFDAILPSIDKLYNELKIQHDPLPVGATITVYYKFKEDDSWTTLGTIDTVDSTETTLSFPTGIVSKKISFKFAFATTDTSKTSVIRETVLKYTLNPDRKWQWNLRILVKGTSAKNKIILLDKTQDTRTASSIRSQIESSQNSDQLIQFIDIDGQSYTVLFHTLDEQSWVINNDSSDLNENTVAVTLIEA